MSPSAHIAGKLRETARWRAIEQEFLASGSAGAVLNGLTEAADAIVREAWRASMETACPESAALVAVGAYARRETFPYSGADLLVLLDRGFQPEPVTTALAEFVHSLWDAGLQWNYTVHTPGQCLDGREPLNLLDRRFLAGDAAPYERLEIRLRAVVARQARELRQLLAQAARARHAQHEDTPRLLWPDVQDAPGGWRDVSLVRQLARLNPDQDPPPEGLAEAAEFLAAVRCFLHYRAGGDHNLLDAEARESLSHAPFAGAAASSLMRQYLRHARLVYREARRALDRAERTEHSILESFADHRARLSNAEFTVTRGRLFLRTPSQLDRDPELVMGAAEFVARHGVPLAHETERRLEGARAPFAAWCAAGRPVWQAWKTILSLPHAAAALRALENCGLLAALIPEWPAIEDLPPAAEEYRYTAGEHTLRTLESAARLRGAAASADARFCELLSELDQRAVLMTSLLFHEIGAEPADEALKRMQAPAADRAAVRFLIERRNALTGAMTGRDLADPATARLLAETAGTVERLKMLAVMSYARISAARGGALTPWRVEQLWRVYSVTHYELTRELETGRIQQVPDNLAGQTGAAADFIRGFPVRYLRARTPADIEMHVRLFEQSRATGAAVRLEPGEGAWRAAIVARDRPYLFASFAAAISSFGLDILKAEAFSNTRGVALDTFVFADPKRLLPLNAGDVERLQDLMRRVALGKTDARRLMRYAQAGGPRKRSVMPRVTFDPAGCETATLVEIVAEDRPGLLYNLATVFSSHACNIDVVLVDTKGRRALDIFYVAFEGHKLPQELEGVLKDQLLAVC